MEYLDFLLGSENLSDLLSRAEVMSDLFAEDQRMILSLNEHLADTEEKLREIEAAQQKCLEHQHENEQNKADLELQKAQAEALMENIQKDIDSYSRAQKEAQAAIAQLDASMKTLLAQIKEKQEREAKAQRQADGDFIWPVDTKYDRISQSYKGSSHTGIDIPTNSTYVNVYASAAGEVQTATSHWSYGNYVVIYHGEYKGDDLQTLYAHLSSIKVKAGEDVKKGQVIGLTGNTGYSFGVHLHFIVYVNGSHVNPLKYVKQP